MKLAHTDLISCLPGNVQLCPHALYHNDIGSPEVQLNNKNHSEWKQAWTFACIHYLFWEAWMLQENCFLLRINDSQQKNLRTFWQQRRIILKIFSKIVLGWPLSQAVKCQNNFLLAFKNVACLFKIFSTVQFLQPFIT